MGVYPYEFIDVLDKFEKKFYHLEENIIHGW